jgi:prepilin-type processing-associated H-X9-DG protein
MSLKSKAGRTTLAALSIVIAAGALAAVALTTRAHAQTTTAANISNYMETFGVFDLNPIPPAAASEPVATVHGGTTALIGLLLPAVQHAAAPFRVQILNEDTDLVVALTPPAGVTTINWGDDIRLTTASVVGGRGFSLSVFNERTGQSETHLTNFERFAVRILPAVQSTHGFIVPVAASVTLNGSNNASFADGSVEPIPFQYAVPAVQLPAVQ